MKIKMLMMETTTTFSDETPSACTVMDASNDCIENNSSFYDGIKHRLDLQLIEPSSNSIDFILNYSREDKANK